MEIKKSRIRELFGKVNKRIALLIVGVLALAGAGTAYYFVLADTEIAGTSVTINMSGELKYGTKFNSSASSSYGSHYYSTHRYSVTYTAGTIDGVDKTGEKYEAVCAEPEKDSPKGKASAVYEMDQTETNETIKRILLTTRIGKDASIEYNGTTYNAYADKVFNWASYASYTDYSSSSTSLSKFDYTSISLGHALVGYVYAGSTKGFTSNFVNDFWKGDSGLIQRIYDIFEQDGYKQLAESVVLRRSEGQMSSGNYQDLIWLENIPQTSEEGMLAVQKRIPEGKESILEDYPDLYTLKDAVFEVYSEGSCENVDGSGTVESDVTGGLVLENAVCEGEPIATLQTGSDGKTEAVSLPIGNYWVKEKTAPTGFFIDSNTYMMTVMDGDTVWFDAYDDPIVGGISLRKVDSETLSIEPQGGAQLYHSRFQINNLNTATPITDQVYSDEEGNVSCDNLPVGSYQIFEVEAADGYVTPSSSSTTRINFTINSDGTSSRDGETIQIQNKVKRGDVKFTKKKKNYLGEESVAAGVPFLIKLLDGDGVTVEQHVIVSDENGVVDTSARRGVNANANDEAFGNDGEMMGGVDYSGKRSSELDKTAGVWFGFGTNGVNDTYKANNGALIYGNYLVTELEIVDNAMYRMSEDGEEFRFSVTEDGVTVDNVGDGGVVMDELVDEPELVTVASAVEGESDASNRANEVEIGESVNIYDYVSYSGLTEGASYKIVAFLTDENGDEVGQGGSRVEGEKTFVAGSEGRGVAQVKLEGVDTSKFVGKSLTVNEELYRVVAGDEVLIVGKHLDPDYSGVSNESIEAMSETENTNQTVKVKTAEITETLATASDGSSKEVNVGFVQIQDKMKVKGLVNEKSYTVKTWVKDEDGNSVEILDENRENGKETLSRTIDYNGATAEVPEPEIAINNIYIDTTKYVGKKLIIYQEIEDEDGNKSTHPNSDSSEEQIAKETVTVKEPGMGTVAYDGDGTNEEDKEIKLSATAKIRDKISYSNLEVGTTYYVSGKVVYINEETGAETVLAEVGKSDEQAKKEATADGYWTMDFTVDTREYAKRKLVVYEYLYAHVDDTEPMLTHEDSSEDGGQVVEVAEVSIGTKARNADDTDSQEVGVGTVNIIDYVEYRGLTVGEQYRLSGTLRKEDGTVVTGGEAVSEPFTAVEDGEANPASVTFYNVDTKDLIGQTLYVTEILYAVGSGDDVEIARHEQNIPEQQIKVKTPEIETVATGESGKEVEVLTDAKVYDKVKLTGLVKGETYSLVSQLVEEGDETGFVEVKRVYPIEFTVENDDGSAEVEVEFTLNTVGLEGKELTVMEWVLYGENKEIVKHTEKIEEQTVQVKKPTLVTEAKSGSLVEGNGDKVVALVDKAKIVDIAEYTGLADGVSYRAFGVLHDQDTGEKLMVKDKDGVEREVTAEKEFVAKGEGGEVELEFEFDATEIPGKNIVVFEYIYYKEGEEETEIVKHEDIESTEQWVEVQPRIGTKVVDEIDGDQAVGVGLATVVDTVEYDGLKIGSKYIVKGKLMDRETGEAVGIEGKSEEFTVTEEMGTTNDKDIKVRFEFETTEMQGRSLVVFEELYEVIEDGEGKEEILRSVHEDIKDEEQWINVKEARVATIAVDGDDGDKELDLEKEALITDTVEYYGLIKGEKYKLVGILMDKETGEGLGVMEKKEFTAEAESGTVEIDFTVDTTEMSGKEIVVFETLYYVGEDEEEVEIAKHQDLEDSSQTVWVKVKTPNTGMFGSVSDGAAVQRVVYAAAVIGALGAVYAVVNRKRKIGF